MSDFLCKAALVAVSFCWKTRSCTCVMTEAGRPLSESPLPIEQVTGKLDALAGMARRTFRRLEDGRWKGFLWLSGM